MSSKLKKFAASAGAAAALTAGLAAVTPGVAHAASYNGACGSGYGVIDAMSLPGLGTVYLTYSSGTGKNCVVTVRDNPGTSRAMAAKVSLSTSSTWIQDVGNYTTYSGPVYVSAKGKCVDWGGEISGVGSYEYNSHCG